MPIQHDSAAVVPCYFVHIEDDRLIAEVLKFESPNMECARREATAYVGEMLQDRPDAFWASQPWRMTVTDEKGAVLLLLTLEGRVPGA
jgi:hypothetical protein